MGLRLPATLPPTQPAARSRPHHLQHVSSRQADAQWARRTSDPSPLPRPPLNTNQPTNQTINQSIKGESEFDHGDNTTRSPGSSLERGSGRLMSWPGNGGVGGINVFRGRRLEQASADALPLTQASLIPGNQNSFSDGEERNDTQKSGFRENNTSTALFFFFPLPKAALRALHILSFILTLSPASG